MLERKLATPNDEHCLVANQIMETSTRLRVPKTSSHELDHTTQAEFNLMQIVEWTRLHLNHNLRVTVQCDCHKANEEAVTHIVKVWKCIGPLSWQHLSRF
jgi:hypothetical protein